MKLRAATVLVAATAAMTSLGASTAVAAGEREVHEMLKREGVMRTDGMVTKHEFLRMMEKRFDALDQCWDLLRQRRALREFGDDPSRARVRDADVVKKYIG